MPSAPFEPDVSAQDVDTAERYIAIGAPKPPGNHVSPLAGDNAQPMIQITVTDAQTKQREVVVVPDIPNALELIKGIVKYANPKAKARVALLHLQGTAKRFEHQRLRTA